MKNFKKGFTLVEMLIVVVIIGILAAAILPRLQGAQAATRDVARDKGLVDLSQALELYYTAKGEYPKLSTSAQAADKYSAKATLQSPLVDERAYLKDIPMDPQVGSRFAVGSTTAFTDNTYGYVPMKKNGADNAAYVLVARVETYDKANATAKMVEQLSPTQDISTLNLCDEVIKGQSEVNASTQNKNCKVTSPDHLRFILVR